MATPSDFGSHFDPDRPHADENRAPPDDRPGFEGEAVDAEAVEREPDDEAMEIVEVDPDDAPPDDENYPAPDEDAERVLTLANEIAQKQGGLWAALALLIVSVALFLGMGAVNKDWKFVLMILPILFVHESGHWLAMKAFGYRNMRMFFIPFFGAAVSGRAFNVEGWKKSVVALAGPVPGVIAGVVLGLVGLATKSPLMSDVALLTLIVNGLNLLPIIPLDGGQNLQTLVFSRHPVMDVVFRGLAAAGLLGLFLVLGDRFLLAIGIFSVMGLPQHYRLAKVTAALGQMDLPTIAPHGQVIPRRTGFEIIDALRGVLPKLQQQDKNVAKVTLNVFELLNARPPGALVTSLLLFVHGGTFLLALLFAGIFFLGKNADLGQFARDAANAPTNEFECGKVERRSGAEVRDDENVERSVVVATYSSGKARQTFDAFSTRLPPKAIATLFGQTVLLSLPADDADGLKRTLAEMFPGSSQAFVAEAKSKPSLRIIVFAPDKEAAEAVENELDDYISCEGRLHLIPPWGVQHPLTAEHRQARSALKRFRKTSLVYDDPELVPLRDAMHKAFERRDMEEGKRLATQSREIVKRLQRDKRNALAAELTDPNEKAVLAAWTALQESVEKGVGMKFKEAEAISEPARAELARLCGQPPLVNGVPSPRDRTELASGGYVTRNGVILNLTIYGLERADVAGPRIAQWLCEKSFHTIRYDFNQFEDYGEEELDDPVEE